MTEQEAKQKWCPMVRLHTNANGSTYDVTPNKSSEIHINCIASDCMMWQWDEDANAQNRIGDCGLKRGLRE